MINVLSNDKLTKCCSSVAPLSVTCIKHKHLFVCLVKLVFFSKQKNDLLTLD